MSEDTPANWWRIYTEPLPLPVRLHGLSIRGRRADDGTLIVEVCAPPSSDQPARATPLPHLARHSPTGFECGYGGSGPADLARSIVGFLCGTDDPHPALADQFKWKVVALMPRRGWRLSTEALWQRLLDCARELGARCPACLDRKGGCTLCHPVSSVSA